jgi:5'-nucleotidase / UDP-sugar diphosphatase
MHIRFDDTGRVTSCDGNPTLLLGDRFSRLTPEGRPAPVDEPTRQTILAWLATRQHALPITPDPMAAAEVEKFAGMMQGFARRIIGQAGEALCLVRIPGEQAGRGSGIAGCEDAHLKAHGSDIAQIVADAFLSASKRADFALQNAGGVRISIPAGPISFETANQLLPFSNVLVELSVTGAELIETLEQGAANHLDHGGSTGSHPYMSGVRWDLDLSQPRGQRFGNIQVRDRNSGDWSPIDPARNYTLVTNDYLASGKEGYATLGRLHASGRTSNTYLLYTQTFVDYVQQKGSVSRPAAADYSHQRVIGRDGGKL